MKKKSLSHPSGADIGWFLADLNFGRGVPAAYTIGLNMFFTKMAGTFSGLRHRAVSHEGVSKVIWSEIEGLISTL